MTAVGKKLCKLFLTALVITLLGISCFFVALMPKNIEMFDLVTKFSGTIFKAVPLSVCCTISYSKPQIRNRTVEDSFYPVTAGDAELQKNISFQQFNEGIFFAEENDLPVLTDVPDEKAPKTGQKWWPVPVIAVAGIALIATAEKAFSRRKHKHYKKHR